MGAEYSAEWFCTVKNGWSRARPVLRIRILLIVRRGVEIFFSNPGPSGTLLTLSFAKILRGNGGSVGPRCAKSALAGQCGRYRPS